MHEPMEK